MTTDTYVMRTLVPEYRRLDVTAGLFGTWLPMRIEPVVFSFAERLSKEYTGGYRDLYTLGNGGVYLAPATE